MNVFQNEYEIISYLNNKKKKEVHILFQELLENLFPNIHDEDIVNAKKYGKYAKCDMVIEVNGEKRGISIKCGAKNSVHIEKINDFVLYLNYLGFKDSEYLLCYLYSDGTNNNSGTKRIAASEYKLTHTSEIDNINIDLLDKNIAENLIRRFLICSDINYKVKVDAFICGTLNDFLWITKDEAVNYLLENANFESTGVHISKLFIQQWDKNLSYNPKYEYCREYIQVKWYSLFDDIIKIMCNRK